MNGYDEPMVVEYSPIQDCIHIDTVAQILKKNLGLLLESDGNGYIPIFMSDDGDAVDEFINKFLSVRKRAGLKYGVSSGLDFRSEREKDGQIY